MEIKTSIHTFFLLVGLNRLGKEVFLEKIILPQLILDCEVPPKFVHLEQNAGDFDQKLLEAIQYPANTEYVFVSVPHLADEFLDYLKRHALKNRYSIEIFDFGDSKSAFHHFSDAKVHRVDYRENLTISSNYDAYATCLLPENKTYHIIGDTHECVAELKTMLEDFGFQFDGSDRVAACPPDDQAFIFLGDFIDKGKQTRQMVEFLFENQKYFYFVLGNHESFVYKYIRGEIKGANQTIVDTYFDSIPVLKADAELLAKFNALVENAKPFYELKGRFIATHAPCKNKYLGKMDEKSLRKMRNFHLNRDMPIQDQLLFLKKEASEKLPFHFFGHVACANAFRIHNKVHLDTGCVHANLLTAAITDGTTVQIHSIPSHHHTTLTKKLPHLF
ncbi:metallophosphoesterase [Listeria goaensis]|uniref:metallophosphoesterase n=1 Tax=Listeria goaensis TaxID=1649188 RepID=UPI000B58E01A|nr:metallophosphoesterase [Listeria goaensis]